MFSSWTTRAATPIAAGLLLGLAAGSALAGGTLRIAMTASDVPTTTGAPDNGYEGVRFLGYPVFEGLVLWDLTSADKLADILAFGIRRRECTDAQAIFLTKSQALHR